MGSGRTEKERVGEAVERYGNKAVEELVDELVEEETPWDQVLANDAIDVRSMSGHRCPDIERSRFKALLLFQWSQRLLSLRPVPPPTLKSMSGWQKFIQTVHIPSCGPQPDPSPSLFTIRSTLPWVDVKYQHVKLAGLKRFETTFQKSAEGVLASKEVELMPLEEMMYYGPSVGKGKEKVENDVVSWQEKDRIEGRLVSANGESTPSVPTIRWLFNNTIFLGKVGSAGRTRHATSCVDGWPTSSNDAAMAMAS
jgi:hypothetical protein